MGRMDIIKKKKIGDILTRINYVLNK
jgi:hypothetical protein